MDALLARARQTLRFATLAGLAATACCGDAQEGGAQGLASAGASDLTPPDGTYDLAFQGRTLPLVVTTAGDGKVVGRIFGPSVTFSLEGIRVVDEDEMSIEGAMVGGGTASEFSLIPGEDGDFGLLLTPLGAEGRPRTEAAAFYHAAYRAPDVEGVASASAATSTTGHPLVGVWATQIMMPSEMGTIATQLFMEFQAEGILVDLGSRTLGTVGIGNPEIGLSGGGERGAWRTEGDVLLLSPDGSAWVPLARFQVEGSRLGLTYLQDGSSQIWQRQGS